MEKFNQYEAPSSPILIMQEDELPIKELKQLYNWSRSIGTFMILNFLAGSWMLLAAIAALEQKQVDIMAIASALSAISLSLALLLLFRHAAGWVMGIFITGLGGFLIFWNPIGGIFSIYCCYIFARSTKLFGLDRLTHFEIKVRYQAAKFRLKG